MSLERILLPNGELPSVIQGGMGIGVSNWKLARAVSMQGQMGVISGSAIDVIFSRRLQDGDEDGKMREAIAAFPLEEISEEILDKYFIEGGKEDNQPYRPTPFPKLRQEGKNLTLESKHLESLTILANFVEVHLAKEGHSGKVGINFLYKIQSPMPQGLYGAMLAGVDAVLMGAGIPKPVPAVLDALSKGEEVSMPFSITGGEGYNLQFNPRNVIGNTNEIDRPCFIGIITNPLGMRSLHNADGYVFESPTAGGHNAPPRVRGIFNENGEPVYGPKDEINWAMLNSILEKRKKSQPFWLAGGYASELGQALDLGAAGVQVGTPFAFCRESGIERSNKKRILEAIMCGAEVFADSRASPTGFPFQILSLEGSLSNDNVYNERERICDQGFLLEFFENEGKINSRCASEPVRQYLRKGGDLVETQDRKCICNALISLAGHPSYRSKNKFLEPPIITSGKDTSFVKKLVNLIGRDYSATNVLRLIGV